MLGVAAAGMRLFSRFVLVGLANTALGYAVILGVTLATGNAWLGNLIAYALVVPVSFISHRRFSFQHDGAPTQAFFRYLPVVVAAYALNALALGVMLHLGAPVLAAQVLAMSLYVVVTFLGGRFIVFRPTNA
jgi:putative flippase GtrA